MTLRQRILERATQVGISPKRSLGQNFLVSDRVVEKIIEQVRIAGIDQIFEIGPGLGSLTDGLRGLPVRLRILELDRELSRYWRAQGLDVIEGDALDFDWRSVQGMALIVSNLPYQISSSLVMDRSLGPSSIQVMVLMFQREVADRLIAKVGTAEYGMLSVVAQVFWEMDPVVDAQPRDFWPAPKISSRVVRFRRRNEGIRFTPREFLQFVKAAFVQRRKLVANNLHSYPGASEALTALGFDPKRHRAENISPGAFVELFMRIRSERG